MSLVVPDSSGKLTIYSVSQARNFHLGMLAGILKIGADALRCECANEWSSRTLSSWRGKTELNRIKMGGTSVGGGFGGKNEIHADHITALLALKTGRPCKWRWTREEELLYSTHRSPVSITFKDGVTKDGRIIARYVKHVRDGELMSAPTHTPPDSILRNGPVTSRLLDAMALQCSPTNRSPARCEALPLRRPPSHLRSKWTRLPMRSAWIHGKFGLRMPC